MKHLMVVWLLWFVLLGAIFADLVLLAHDRRLSLQKVEITGLQTQVISESEVQAQVEQALGGNYWWFWPRHNALIYPKQEINQSLRQHFPAIRHLTLTKSDLNTLAINLTERRGEYIWCGADSEPCYFLDQSGFAFALAPQISGQSFLTFSTVATSSLATQLLPETEFRTVLNLVALINRNLAMSVKLANYKITKVALLADGELKLTASTGVISSDFSVLLNQNETSAGLESVLSAALNVPTLGQDLATSTLDYLDLRFPGKMYYKLK